MRLDAGQSNVGGFGRAGFGPNPGQFASWGAKIGSMRDRDTMLRWSFALGA
jgi:hypothetical protein